MPMRCMALLRLAPMLAAVLRLAGREALRSAHSAVIGEWAVGIRGHEFSGLRLQQDVVRKMCG